MVMGGGGGGGGGAQLNFGCGPSISDVHLASTRHHLCDSRSPFFATLSLPCIILNATEEQRIGEAWERG